MSTPHHDLEQTRPSNFSPSSLINTFRSISADSTDAHDHARVTQADLSAPFLRTPDEEARLVADLRRAAADAANPRVANAHAFWLLAAIRARKGDVHRALPLLANFIRWRDSVSADQYSLARCEKMRRQLARKIIFVTGHTDKHGRPIFNMRSRNHDPSQFSAMDTIRMVTFVLEWTLRTYPAAQTHGVVFMSDLSDVRFSNLDVRLPGLMQKAFSNNLPVRLAALNIMHPPFFMKAILGILTAVLGDKLKARIRPYGKGDETHLFEHFEKDQILEDLGFGGTARWTDEQHNAWMDRMISDCQSWPAVTTVDDASAA